MLTEVDDRTRERLALVDTSLSGQPVVRELDAIIADAASGSRWSTTMSPSSPAWRLFPGPAHLLALYSASQTEAERLPRASTAASTTPASPRRCSRHCLRYSTRSEHERRTRHRPHPSLGNFTAQRVRQPTGTGKAGRLRPARAREHCNIQNCHCTFPIGPSIRGISSTSLPAVCQTWPILPF